MPYIKHPNNRTMLYHKCDILSDNKVLSCGFVYLSCTLVLVYVTEIGHVDDMDIIIEPEIISVI